MTPFEGDGVWLRCALHAHTTNSDGELSPDMLVRHYEWAGYDVLAITDHWVRTVEPSTRKLLVIPSTELNGVAAGSRFAPAGLGVEADPEPPDEFAPLADVVAWTLENQRCSVPRAHVLERAPNVRLGGVRGPRRDRGLEHRLRARDRARRLVRALGRGARSRARALRARDRRLAPPRLRQRLRVDDGARGGAVAGRGARRIA